MLSRWLLVLCVMVLFMDGKVLACSNSTVPKNLKLIRSWKYVDFDYDNEEQKKNYDPARVAPIDVDTWRDKTFVTLIRNEGVPASLTTITDKSGPGGPLVRPYPNWDWADSSNCSNIVNSYRVAIDECDRLWVLDSGKIGYDFVCQAKIVVFDLTTSKLIQTIMIPDEIARNSTTGTGFLVTPIVDSSKCNCDKFIVYIADVQGYAVIVYDGNRFQRLISSALMYDPAATTFTIEGQSFSYKDGPLGMALSPKTKKLYLSPMSSYNLVSLDTIRFSLEKGNVQFNERKNVLWTQASAKVVSHDGTLFLGLVSDTAIGCWNERKPLTRRNIGIVAQDRETLQFTSGLKIKSSYQHGDVEEDLLIMTNRFQKITTNTININETNFRMMKGKVRELTRNTVCSTF